MAVDSSLISGAYQANAPVVTTGGVAEGLSDLGGTITEEVESFVSEEKDKLSEEKDKLNKTSSEYDSFVDRIVDGSELEGSELGALHDNLSNGKQKYLDADDKGKAVIRQELNKMYEDYDSFENLKEKFAGLDGDVSIAFTNSDQGKQLIEVLSNPSKFMKMKDGRVGMEFDGEFKTVNELNKMVEGGLKDNSFVDIFDVAEAKSAIQKEDYSEKPFDEFNTHRTFSKYIDRTKNLKSLMYDKHVGDTSFKEDLLDSMNGKTYSQLGITPDMLKEFDTNSDNELSPEEKINLVDSLEDNPKILKDMLADYFTDLVRQSSGYDIKPVSTTSDNSSNDNTPTGPKSEGDSKEYSNALIWSPNSK